MLRCCYEIRPNLGGKYPEESQSGAILREIEALQSRPLSFERSLPLLEPGAALLMPLPANKRELQTIVDGRVLSDSSGPQVN